MSCQPVEPFGRAVAYWVFTSTTGLLSAMIFQIFCPMLMIWSRTGSVSPMPPPPPPGEGMSEGETVGPTFEMWIVFSSSVYILGSFCAAFSSSGWNCDQAGTVIMMIMREAGIMRDIDICASTGFLGLGFET